MRETSPKIPTTDEWNWQMKANCRETDSNVFFHPDGERGKARASRERRAKEICRSCEVLMQCRSYALKADERYGTWGGMSESELRAEKWSATRRNREAS